MPSPIGHGLGGIAAGWLVGGAPGERPVGLAAWWREGVLYAVLGMLPDLDLLIGAHSGPTHGVGAAVLAGAAAWTPGATPAQPGEWDRARVAVACGCAYASHILLDWLGTDTSVPIGIMALWPATREYYNSGLNVFMAVSRRYWQGARFWRQNLLALARELLILVPVLVVIHAIRRRPAAPERPREPSRLPQHPEHQNQHRERERGEHES